MIGATGFSWKELICFISQRGRVYLVFESEHIGNVDISYIQKTGFFHPDIDKGYLHSRENFGDFTQVNISNNTFIGFVLDK